MRVVPESPQQPDIRITLTWDEALELMNILRASIAVRERPLATAISTELYRIFHG